MSCQEDPPLGRSGSEGRDGGLKIFVAVNPVARWRGFRPMEGTRRQRPSPGPRTRPAVEIVLANWPGRGFAIARWRWEGARGQMPDAEAVAEECTFGRAGSQPRSGIRTARARRSLFVSTLRASARAHKQARTVGLPRGPCRWGMIKLRRLEEWPSLVRPISVFGN
jgi:hypothetical protein